MKSLGIDKIGGRVVEVEMSSSEQLRHESKATADKGCFTNYPNVWRFAR